MLSTKWIAPGSQGFKAQLTCVTSLAVRFMNQERGLVVTSLHQASQAVTRPLDQQPREDLPRWANHLQGAPLTTLLTTQLGNCYYLICKSETEQDFSQVITPRELEFEMKPLTLKCIFPVLCVWGGGLLCNPGWIWTHNTARLKFLLKSGIAG